MVVPPAVDYKFSKLMKSQLAVLYLFDHHDERILRGVAEYAQRKGWHFTPVDVSSSKPPSGWRADGIITYYQNAKMGPDLDPDIPVVDLSRGTSDVASHRISENYLKIGETAARYFLSRGFSNFLFYHEGNKGMWNEMEGAFRSTIVTRNAEHKVTRLKHPRFDSFAASEELAAFLKDHFEKMTMPLAVLVPDDELAALFLETCHNSDIKIPDDVAVMGVGDTPVLCSSLSVPLSSVDTHRNLLGALGAEVLEAAMLNRSGAQKDILLDTCEVVERQSTETLAVGHGGVRKALLYMRDHYGEPLTIDGLAEEVGMSKRALEKAFYQTLRNSPSATLRSIRIQNAKNLLLETDMKIDSVALACGYSNSSNLSLAFKREVRMTPHAFRSQNRIRQGTI